jgi:hypothetical protein
MPLEMTICRRRFLSSASAAALAVCLPIVSLRAAEPEDAGTSFNGGRTQFNTKSVQHGGDYTFIDLMKMSQGWIYNRPPSDPKAPPSPIIELDPDGYITSIVPGTNGVYTVFQMPTRSQYAGEWILSWDGNGTLEIGSFATTWVSGGLTTVRGSGSYTFKRADDGGSPSIRIVATRPTPHHVRNIRLFKAANKSLLDRGEQFDPDSLALIRSARPGVIRSLGWGGAFCGTSESLIATWAQRRPRSYVTYAGYYANSASYGGRTTNSGTDYVLDYPGFALTNKAMLTVLFNASAPQSGRADLRYATRAGQEILIAWPAHGLSAGNTVCFGNGKSPPLPLVSARTYFIERVVDADAFTVSATSGGPPVLAASTGAGNYFGVSIPRININNAGFVPVTGARTPFPNDVFVGWNTQYPVAGLCILIYDRTIGYFYLQQGGYIAGAPPEVFIDYCAAVGAHPHLVAPHLSLEPLSDYMPEWVSYAKNKYPWMKPRIEPPNECWNTAPVFLPTPYARSLSYALWGDESPTSWDNAYGKWCSTIGQAMAALFENDRSRYSMICAVQTASLYSSNPGDSVNARLMSTLYVSRSGGEPAYKWVDRVCGAPYYASKAADTTQELIDAYRYAVTCAGDPAQQAAILNNYVAQCAGSLSEVNRFFTNLKRWAQAMPAGSTVAGITSYEGGYAIDDPRSGDWFSAVVAATNTANCVLVLGGSGNPYNNELPQRPGPATPAVIGMEIKLSGLTGGFADYNGRTARITDVSGNRITTDLDTSTQANVFSGRALVTYVNSAAYANGLRFASKSATGLGAQNTSMYASLAALASRDFVSEYPSNFLYTGPANGWSVLDPDIYAPPTSQWESIVAYNNR